MILLQSTFSPHTVLVISIDQQLRSNTAATALWLTAKLKVLQETIVDELSFNVTTAVQGSTVLSPTDTLTSYTPLGGSHTTGTESLDMCVFIQVTVLVGCMCVCMCACVYQCMCAWYMQHVPCCQIYSLYYLSHDHNCNLSFLTYVYKQCSPGSRNWHNHDGRPSCRQEWWHSKEHGCDQHLSCASSAVSGTPER